VGVVHDLHAVILSRELYAGISILTSRPTDNEYHAIEGEQITVFELRVHSR
jgi:hypothetical protein